MKRTRPHPALLGALFLALGLPVPCGRATAEASVVPANGRGVSSSFVNLLDAIEALGPRPENSVAERAAFDLIESTCGAARLQVTSLSFSDSSDGYSYSRILETSIPGKRKDELIVMVPVDSWIDATDGKEGAAGIAVALAEAASLGNMARSGKLPPLSLRFVFLGAERRGERDSGQEASLGTRTWIAEANLPESAAVLYLSIDEIPQSLLLENAGRGTLSPWWLYDRTRLALKGAGFPLHLEANRMQIYRLGLADSYGPAAPYLEANLAALAIRGEGTASTGEEAAFGTRFSTFLGTLMDENGSGFSESWDRHYLIFQLGGLSAVVREPIYVGFLLCFSAAALIIALLLSVTRRDEMKAIAYRMPVIVGQLVSLFLALCAILLAERGGAAVDSLVLGSADYWRLAPRVFLLARILSSFCLFLSLLSILVERRLLSANPYFYEFAALVCLAFDILIFAAIRLPVSFYFVWAFIIVALSLGLRRPSTTIVAYLVMYAPLLLLAVELVLRPELSLYRRIIVQGFGGVLALAATTLPFFTFGASPLLFYAKAGLRARTRTALLFAGLALAIEAGALAYVVVGTEGRGQGQSASAALTLSESYDQDTGLFSDRLRGYRRLGRGVLVRGGSRLVYQASGDSATISGEDSLRPLTVRQNRSFFLDRVTDRIDILCSRAPYAVRLQLRSASDLQIYDCDLPLKVSLDGRTAEIFAGVNPGDRLAFSLTVPRSFRATLAVTAEYLHPLVTCTYEDGRVAQGEDFSVRTETLLQGEANR